MNSRILEDCDRMAGTENYYFVDWWQMHSQKDATHESCLLIIHLKPNLERGVVIQVEVGVFTWLIVILYNFKI